MKLDTTKWIPAHVLAAKLNVTRQVVHNWIKRKKLITIYVDDWEMELVDATFTPKPKQPDR
jgi:hypothetical protein